MISEENSKITLKAWGSRIFTPGMNGDVSAGKGTSRNADRHMKRATRIQQQRRRMRKKLIVKVLTDAGFLPEILTDDFFVAMDKRMLATVPESDRTRCAHVLPYLYRKAALDCPLEPHELGRTLFHLAQRRGFLSNRKADLKEDENSIGKLKEGIRKLEEDMQTAGAHFRRILLHAGSGGGTHPFALYGARHVPCGVRTNLRSAEGIDSG